MFPGAPSTLREMFTRMATPTTCSTRSCKDCHKEICEALVAFDPEHQADFTRNRDAYLVKLDDKIADWGRE